MTKWLVTIYRAVEVEAETADEAITKTEENMKAYVAAFGPWHVSVPYPMRGLKPDVEKIS